MIRLALGVACAVAASGTVRAQASAAQAAAAALNIPDFQKASVADLASAASQALEGLKQAAGGGAASASSGLLDKAKAVQAALSAGRTGDALTALSGLTEAAKAVPGATKLAEASKQLVSAWALKQGFDASKILGVLGALQKQDAGSLASKATGLLSKGGLSGEQQGLLQGVLGAYGIDTSKAAGAAGLLKGFMGN